MKTARGHSVLKHIIQENVYKSFEKNQLQIMYKLPGGFANFSGDLNTIRLCYEAGFMFADIEEIEELDFVELAQDKQGLVKELHTVRSLRSLCRVAIRSRLGRPLSKLVLHLGLPQVMNDYLMFTDNLGLT